MNSWLARSLCRVGVHRRRRFICPMCLYLARPPGEALWISRCLNSRCSEVGPRFCQNHEEAT
jgi:hypothetical protein